MFIHQLKIAAWGANIRMGIATVIIFWTPVEILGRMNFFKEIWIDPMRYKTEMLITLAAFVLLATYLWYVAGKRKMKG
jgi:hypothetical protein